MSEPRASAFDPGDLETLAAFIDGRLEGAERDAVVERLANDEDYYEVYAETLHFLEAESPTPSSGGDPVWPERPEADVPGSGRSSGTTGSSETSGSSETDGSSGTRGSSTITEFDGTGTPSVPSVSMPTAPRRRWLPATAALAAGSVLAIGVWYGLATPRGAQDYYAYVRSDAPTTYLAWSALRSNIFVPEWLSAEGAAVRAAVDRLRLESALDRGDLDEAETAAHRFDAHFEAAIGFPLLFATEDLATIVKGGEIERAEALLDDAETMLLEAMPDAYRLGLWTQSCAWAAEAGDDSFFNARTWRAFDRLEVRAWLDEPALLAEVDSISGNRPRDAQELARLGTVCTKLGKAGGDRPRD